MDLSTVGPQPGVLASSTASAPESRRRWLIGAILFLIVIAGFFDRISIAVLFTNQPFQAAMGTGFNPTRLSLLMSSFLIAYGISNVALSPLVDLFGPSRTLFVSIVAWGVLMALMGQSSTFGAMLIFRALLGIAEGPQFSIANSLVAQWFPARERARANSMWSIGSPLGSAIGFPVTAWLVAHYGWRSSFYCLAALNLVVILPLAFAFVREGAGGDRTEQTARAAPRMSYTASVKALALDWRYWLIVIFACGTLVFLWGLNTWLPTYLVNQRHLPPQRAGIYSALPFILVVLGQFGGSYISDRIGKRALVAGGGLFLAGVFIYFVSFTPSAELAAVVIALSGFFWGMATPVSYALILDLVPRGALATAVGVKNGIGNVVGSLAPVAMGVVIARTGSFDTAFLVLVASGVIGGLIMMPLMRSY